MENQIETKILHWAKTPENGYLGSSYGGKTSIESALNENNEENIISILKKLKQDIPDIYMSSVEVRVIDSLTVEFFVNKELIIVKFNEV